jgi:hypothetical protein
MTRFFGMTFTKYALNLKIGKPKNKSETNNILIYSMTCLYHEIKKSTVKPVSRGHIRVKEKNDLIGVLVLDATFNNISAISWRL